PFGDSSALPSLLVAKLARERVSVVLTGDGGDELFAGYPRVWKTYVADKWRRRIGRFGGRVLKAVGGNLYHLPGRVGALGHRTRTFGILINQGAPAQYEANPALLSMNEYDVLGERVRSVLRAHSPLEKSRNRFDLVTSENEAERMMWHDVNFRLTSDYLTKVDSATMYYALEARCPFLDIELWQYAAKLTMLDRMPGGRRKGLLSDLAADTLPKSAILRQKQGFGIPFYEWLRGPWYGFWQDLFESSTSSRLGLLDDAGVRRMLEAHRNGKNHSVCLWNLAMLELWLRANHF
ncbi:MAG: asparagine synthase-related protein, partial [bacterium]